MTAEPFLEFRECAGCGETFAMQYCGRGWHAKWCSERCRKASYGDPCVDCGARTCYGAETARVPEPRCVRCERARISARKQTRLERAVALRTEGLLNHEIAERLGTTQQAVANLLSRAKHEGMSVPPTPYEPALTLAEARKARAAA